ncbi:MAG: hypothetical protein L6R39_003640 [Caloplaca ligustica]|nr:MAG: hypothetical protein L6R39_003640 [Caloplaca ligustica]
MDGKEGESHIKTQVLPVDVNNIGEFVFHEPEKSFLGHWDVQLRKDSHDAANLLQAVKRLQTSSLPVAFPTETVYGLGADATREDAVAGIYKAKQRPADNPLIVHISSLTQLRRLLSSSSAPGLDGTHPGDTRQDPIPAIYHPLISRFWPGPLTILLPLPEPSPLAPSVTGTLSTFGVRMPSSRLALALIHLAGLPIAAPSANASTRPSPTTAAHVLHDLSGRIELILDGGPCSVGVESTVVDGLVHPPVILRPGGVSLEMLRQCSGWEHAEVGYRDGAETGVPRAPGMKYKHYSPTARVILVHGPLSLQLLTKHLGQRRNVGLATTKTWGVGGLPASGAYVTAPTLEGEDTLRRFTIQNRTAESSFATANINGQRDKPDTAQTYTNGENSEDPDTINVVSIDLGTETASIAQNLFSALRELDLQGVDVIFVEAISATEGHAAAAVMNRLRKAAELEIQP